MINTFITCPTDCDTNIVLGDIPVNQDCTDYPQRYAQICGVVLTPIGAAAPIDWTAAPNVTLVVGEIDNADVTGTKSKYIVVEGEIGDPGEDEVEYPKRQTVVANRTYEASLTVKNLEDGMYDLLRLLQCPGAASQFTVQYETIGGWLFGNDDGSGINLTYLTSVFNRPGGRDDRESATIRMRWDAITDPDRGLSPL